MITKVMLMLTIIFGDVKIKTPLMVLLSRGELDDFTVELDDWTKELEYIAQIATLQAYNMGLYKKGTVLHVRGDTPYGNTINITKKIMYNDADAEAFAGFLDNLNPNMFMRYMAYMEQQCKENVIADYIVDNIS